MIIRKLARPATMDDIARELEPYLGWYEGQDPSVVLGSGKSDTLAARDYMPPELELSLKEHYEFRRAS